MPTVPVDVPLGMPASAGTEQRWRYEGWTVAFASAAGMFCWSLPPLSFPVFLKPIAEEFAWNRQMVASAFGVSALVAAVFAAPVGYLVDRAGARRVVLPSLAIAGGAFLVRAWIEPRLWQVALLFGLSGLAGLGAGPVAYGRLLASWFQRRRGQALGILMAGSAAGAIVHPLAAQVLIDHYGWRAAQWMLGACMLLGLPVIARFVRDKGDAAGEVAGATSAGVTAAVAVRTRVFWSLAFVLFCDSLANGSLAVHLPALLSDRGVDDASAALALSAMGAAALGGRLAAGWLLDRYVAIHVSVAMLIVAAAGLLILTTATSLAAGATGAAMVGLGMGGESDVTPFLLTRYFGLRSFSTLYGATFTATAIAWGVGPSLMGRAFDLEGGYAPHLVRLAGLLIVAVVVMLTLPAVGRLDPEVSHADV